jgi:hypothetical protein
MKTFGKLLKSFFKPATLTNAFPVNDYLAPVRSIFFSFITFFLITVFPNSDSITSNSTDDKVVAQSVNEELIKVVK